jgi:hypothetical protein
MAAHKSFHASIHYQMMSFISTILTLPKNEFVIKQNRQHLMPFKLKTWNKTAIVAATIVMLFKNKNKKFQFQLHCRLFWGVFISLFFDRATQLIFCVNEKKWRRAMRWQQVFNLILNLLCTGNNNNNNITFATQSIIWDEVVIPISFTPIRVWWPFARYNI